MWIIAAIAIPVIVILAVYLNHLGRRLKLKNDGIIDHKSSHGEQTFMPDPGPAGQMLRQYGNWSLERDDD